MKRFSVIIPLYNKESTIERAIQSCLSQTFADFELIIVDDGSNDGSIERVKKFQDRRIRIIHQENGGVSSARNTGIVSAQNEYITFLDADDEYLPCFLEEQKSLIEDFPEAGIWGTKYWLSFPNGKKTLPKIKGVPSNFRGYISDYFTIASQSAPIYCAISVCVRKKILQEINGFPVGVRTGEDLMTWARICAKYPCAYSNSPGAIYHCFTSNTEAPRVPPVRDVVGECLEELYARVPSPGLRHYLGLWHKIRGVNLINCHYRKRAIREFCIAIYYAPWKWKTWLNLGMTLMPDMLHKFIRKIRVGV